MATDVYHDGVRGKEDDQEPWGMWLLYVEVVERLVWDRQTRMEEAQKPQSNLWYFRGRYRQQIPRH